MISLDTNILVYAADLEAAERHAAAKQIVGAAAAADSALTEQCLMEFLNVSLRKRRSFGEAAAIVRELRASFRLLVPDSSITETVLNLMERYNLAVWDARLVAVCAANGCDVLLSEDMQDGAAYGAVHILNPFAPKNGALLRDVLSR